MLIDSKRVYVIKLTKPDTVVYLRPIMVDGPFERAFAKFEEIAHVCKSVLIPTKEIADRLMQLYKLKPDEAVVIEELRMIVSIEPVKEGDNAEETTTG